MQGAWTAWHTNGKKKEMSEYRDSVVHGTMGLWYDNGQKYAEGETADGRALKLKCWTPEGQETAPRPDKKLGLKCPWSLQACHVSQHRNRIS